ncbi:propionyl-CoA synthetase [Bacterioplanoides sp. SCSIO 12839]|uniref:propionyl-CoA synthetase n=1 Tax=Bacterioplanoides sp. SCSIO 12839 TaxID=2829569 RepID=UPI0021062E50|nr:propionyl-CoA synthetase [Bacterioplanoides sp. SCSIO 12839]UTW49777.1 propionyl-CoA synthetase [Bacterioplanoides sp. SCSIO 12839]
MSYQKQYQASVEQPDVFWQEQAQKIHWFKQPSNILSKDENGVDRWYANGELNTAYLALDHHVLNGRGDQTALIYDSPVTGNKAQYTYSELTEAVAHFAGVLAAQGVEKGDRVIVYMPMIPEAAIAMLACARIGAIHSVVFGGFAPHELAVRIDDAEPKVVVSASCGIEVDRIIEYKPILDEAIELAESKPSRCVILQRPEKTCELTAGRDLDWQQAVADAKPADCVSVRSTDPLYVLYTSGTTGKPKGVVRDNGGHAVAMNYSMEVVYDMHPGDVFWAASDVGWVVGHSYIVYGPLIRGCTTVFYEGKPVRTPDAGAFWRVCEEYKVKGIFAAPTAFRAIRKEDPECELAKQYDLSALKTVFMAGERLDPPTYDWVDQHIQRPIVDHWWQTETGWAIAGNHMGLEPTAPKAGSVTRPSPGYNVQILDSRGNPVEAGEQGSIAIKLPLPPGCLPTIWHNHERFEAGYLNTYPGYYVSGDGGMLDEDGYLFVLGRTDDIINVAGHRLSTGEMEEVVAGHEAVAECAVIGQSSDLKGEEPLGLVLLKDGIDIDEEQLKKELVQRVRDNIGAVASFKNAVVVQRLPKTRSGKILRKVLRNIANNEEYVAPSTIDDPACLTEIEGTLSDKGLR